MQCVGVSKYILLHLYAIIVIMTDLIGQKVHLIAFNSI